MTEHHLKHHDSDLLLRFRQYLKEADPIERKHRLKASVIRLIRIGAVKVVKS